MSIYLSLDTEATGLTEECVLIQLAIVPVDTERREIIHSLGREWLVKCEPFEKLKPTLNKWVIEHNEGLIRKASAEGLTVEELRAQLTAYFKDPFFDVFKRSNGEKSRPVLLGKSLSALDLPLLARTFGPTFLRDHFHHHTVDVTCLARALVDSGVFPPGTDSSSKLLPYLGVRADALHTALSDAEDMALAYLRMLEKLKPSFLQKIFPFLRR